MLCHNTNTVRLKLDDLMFGFDEVQVDNGAWTTWHAGLSLGKLLILGGQACVRSWSAATEVAHVMTHL